NLVCRALAGTVPGGTPSVVPTSVSSTSGWPPTFSLFAMLGGRTLVTVVQGLLPPGVTTVVQPATDLPATPAAPTTGLPLTVSLETPVTVTTPWCPHSTSLEVVRVLPMAQLTSIALVTCTATSIAFKVIF